MAYAYDTVLLRFLTTKTSSDQFGVYPLQNCFCNLISLNVHQL